MLGEREREPQRGKETHHSKRKKHSKQAKFKKSGVVCIAHTCTPVLPATWKNEERGLFDPKR
jgi:coproporphyrinogen III oxidase